MAIDGNKVLENRFIITIYDLRANGVITGADRSKVTQDIWVLRGSLVNDNDDEEDDEDVRAPISLYE